MPIIVYRLVTMGWLIFKTIVTTQRIHSACFGDI